MDPVSMDYVGSWCYCPEYHVNLEFIDPYSNLINECFLISISDGSPRFWSMYMARPKTEALDFTLLCTPLFLSENPAEFIDTDTQTRLGTSLCDFRHHSILVPNGAC